MLIYYIKRIINDKTKLLLIIFILILPFSEIFFYLKNISMGGEVPKADFSCFLTGNTHGLRHVLQTVYLWFMPLYLLIITGDDCIEDYNSGYINLLISKTGKKRYYANNLIKGFVFSFLIVFISLFLNFIFVHILFFTPSSQNSCELLSTETEFYKWTMSHTSLTNLIYIFLTSLIFGVTGMTENAMSIFFNNRKIVYPLEIILWFSALVCKKSIMLFIQPFTEYDITYALDTFILYLLVNIVLTSVLIILRIKYEKI